MPQTVLVVDDDVNSRVLYSTALLEHGYGVLTAQNGAECVHLARRTKPAAILLDLRMPVMDGFQALRYLKHYRETRTIPVCAMTAYPISEDERESAKLPECFLEKPISGRRVVEEIEARIGPPRRPLPGKAPQPPSPAD